MLTFTSQRNLYGDLTNNETTANLALGDSIIQAETRRLVAKLGDNFLQTTGTAQVNGTAQTRYQLPNRLKTLRRVRVQDGANFYPVEPSPNRKHWDYLTYSGTSVTATYPSYYYVSGGRQIEFWPLMSGTTQIIHFDYDKRHLDQTVADYTTGAVGTATINSTAVTGSATVWTESMNGRFLQIAKSNTYANDGDADWYEIDYVISSTALALKRAYMGHTITQGNASYVIGEVSPLPDGFHELPVYRGAEFYFSKNDEARSQYFRQLANDLETDLLSANTATESVVLDDPYDTEIPPNINSYPRSIG